MGMDHRIRSAKPPQRRTLILVPGLQKITFLELLLPAVSVIGSHRMVQITNTAKQTLWDTSHYKLEFERKFLPCFWSHFNPVVFYNLSTECKHCCSHSESVWWPQNDPNTFIKDCKASKYIDMNSKKKTKLLILQSWLSDKSPSCTTVTELLNVIPENV